MRIFDFGCAGCGHTFEAFVREGDDAQVCPQCGGRETSRQPVLQIRTRQARRGRTIDLGSNSCPCAAHGPGHARR